MTVAKSIIVGVATSALAFLLLYIIGIVLVLQRQRSQLTQSAIGWDPVRALSLGGFTLYLIAAFVVGYWVAHYKIK